MRKAGPKETPASELTTKKGELEGDGIALQALWDLDPMWDPGSGSGRKGKSPVENKKSRFFRRFLESDS